MVGLTYATYVSSLATLAVFDAMDTNFLALIPDTIDYAEQRMYRKLDLLSTVTRANGTLQVGTRNFTLPTSGGRFVVTNGFNIITPSTTTNPDLGTRNQLTPTTRDVLDLLWPSTAGAGVPSLYAMITDQLIIVAPFPDATYTIECIGTIRPDPLSGTTTTTILSQYLPDAFLACSMIFLSGGLLKNFGAQADNPQMVQSWEGQYKELFASANIEEMRKKYASGAWGSLAPTPIATATR